MIEVFGRIKLACFVAVGLIAAAPASRAGEMASEFAGNLLGSVVDAIGTPQMGASVLLYDSYERVVRKTSTGADGRFGFSRLAPSLYSIRISLPSLLPADRKRIAVSAGLSSVLKIRMATLVSSVELQYTKPTAAMSEDWRWVLRASNATRVITRELPVGTASSSAENIPQRFSDTRALVSLSGGDAGSLLSDVNLADFGTSFALATTLLGRNRFTVSGAFGQSLQSGLPNMGVRATYARTDENGEPFMPEITATARQVSLQRHGMGTGPDGDQALRSSVMSYYDTLNVGEAVRFEYGSSLESVSYINHASRVSPFARMTSSLGKIGTLAVTFSNGGNPNELYTHQMGDQPDLEGTVSALSSFSPFSVRNNRLELQRTRNFEAGMTKVVASRTYAVSGFSENVQNGRLTVAGDLTGLDPSSVVSDAATTTSIYNIGSYNRRGVMAALTQRVTDDLDLTFSGGAIGGFSDNGQLTQTANFLRQGTYGVASVGVRTHVPGLKTQVVGNYEYVDGKAIIPRHIFSTQRLYAEPGFNLIVRQPLPSFFGVGKLELSADLRNLLAQGYLPLSSDGQQTLLVQAPRAVRGGLNIIF